MRDHVLRMMDMANKLVPMNLPLPDEFVVHLILASLPKEFDNFVVNYNYSPKKWTYDKFIANCVQHEETLKQSNGGSLNYVKDNNKKNFNPSTSKGKQHQPPPQQREWTVEKDQCLHCKKKGHFKKNCPDFLKEFMVRRGIHFNEDHGKKQRFH